MHSLFRAMIIVAGLVLSAGVVAAPCAGFTDVDDTSAFCPNVDWVKNRAITTGCAAATYCPGVNVTRLEMAAFLNRLGTAMTPIQLSAEASPGPIDLDAGPVVCQTTDLAAVNHPRRAIGDGTLSATAGGNTGIAVELMISSDKGVTWTALNPGNNLSHVVANRWNAIPLVAHVDMAPGVAARFGMRVSRHTFPGPVDVTDSRCQVRVLVFSRDGTSSPY